MIKPRIKLVEEKTGDLFEDNVNNLLEELEKDGGHIVDIKYQCGKPHREDPFYSALIIYEL